MRLYSDVDLLAAEALRHGVWDDLTPAGPRRGAVGAGLRGAPLRRRTRPAGARRRGQDASSTRRSRLWADLDALEREHKLDFLRPPDLGFAWIAYRWAEGDDLDDLLGDSDLSAGDFVRWMKQLLDLAGQVADAAGDSPLRETAREAVRACARGVVAYSGLAETDAIGLGDRTRRRRRGSTGRRWWRRRRAPRRRRPPRRRGSRHRARRRRRGRPARCAASSVSRPGRMIVQSRSLARSAASASRLAST